MIDSYVINIVAAASVELFKLVGSQFNTTHLNRASLKTKDQLPQWSNLIEHLEELLGSADLVKLASLGTDSREFQEFIRGSGWFGAADGNEESASAVLALFMANLKMEILKSEDRWLYQDHKIDRLLANHEEILGQLSEAHPTTDTEVDDFVSAREFHTALNLINRRLRKKELRVKMQAALRRAKADCLFQRGARDEALVEAERAFKLDATDQSKSLLAIILLERDDRRDDGYKLAKSIAADDPKSNIKFNAHIRCLGYEKSVDELARLSEHQEITPIQLLVIGQLLLTLGEKEKALQSTERAYHGMSESPVALALFAHLKLLNSGKPSGSQEWCQLALSLEAALKTFTAIEDPLIHEILLTSRTEIAVKTRRHDEVQTWSEMLRSQYPGEFRGWFYGARSLRRQGKVSDAIGLLRRAIESVDHTELTLELAGCLLAKGRADDLEELLGLLRPVLTAKAPRLSAHAFDYVLEALRLAQSDEARHYHDELESLAKHSREHGLTLAMDLARIERWDDSLDLMRELTSLGGDDDFELRAQIQMAQIAFWAENYQLAADLLEKIQLVEQDPYLTLTLVKCLRHTQRAEDAYEYAKKFLDNNAYDRKIAEQKADIALQVGVIGESIATLRLLAESEPDELLVHLNLLEHAHAEDSEDIEALIDNCVKREQLGTALQRMRLAQLLAKMGKDEAFDLAYRVARENPNDPKILSYLVGMTLLLPRPTIPECVADQTWIEIKSSSGGVKDFTLDSRFSDWFSDVPNHSWLEKLAGKRVGDEVVIKEDEVWRVLMIGPVHFGLLRQAFKDLTGRFADHGSLTKMEVGKNQINIFLHVDENSRNAESRLAEYSAGKSPLALTALHVQKDPVTMWLSLTAENEPGLVGCTGTQAELDAELTTLRGGRHLILSTTGFLALQRLDLIETVRASFERVSIPRSVHFELRQARNSLTAHAHYFGKIDGAFAFVECPPNIKTAFDRLIGEYLTGAGSLELQPVWIRGELSPHPRINDLDHILGKGAVDAALSAGEEGAIVIEDDLCTRSTLHHHLEVETASVQSLATYLREIDAVTTPDYHTILKKLLLSGYTFVRFDDDLLTHLLFAPGGQTALFMALRKLAPPCSLEAASHLLAKFLKVIVTGSLELNRQHLLFQQVVLTARTHSNGLNRIREVIPGVFGPYLHQEAHKVIEELSFWAIVPRKIHSDL